MAMPNSRFLRSSPARIREQRGAALIVGLMFLVLITLLATIAMRQSITQERMAGGLRNATLARNGADTAIRLAERRIYSNFLTSNGTAQRGDVNATQGIWLADQAVVETFRNYRGYTTTSAQTFPTARYDFSDTSTRPTATLARQPSFIIADVGEMRQAGTGKQGEGGQTGTANYEGAAASSGGNGRMELFRITARSTGGNEAVTRAVETTYSAPVK